MGSRHRLLAALPTTYQVQETLSKAPCALPSAALERSKLLERKLRTQAPVRMAEVVRDLACRQRKGRATERDVRFLSRADRELAHWLAGQTGEERAWVRRRTWGTVERSISVFTRQPTERIPCK
jgi:RNA polymerase-interacting CarD/CdnL/TRCF family regulator